MNRTHDHIQHSRELSDTWRRIKAGVFALAFAVTAYSAIVVIPAGTFTYLLALPAAGIVLITAWYRVNAVGVEMATTLWNVRRGGLILSAVFALSVFVWPWIQGEWTPWPVVIGIWGYAMTWLTTPNQEPWVVLVFGRTFGGKPYESPQRHKSDVADPPDKERLV